MTEGKSTFATFNVDEAGDGVLFGPKGQNLLHNPSTPRFFMLGMVRCTKDAEVDAAFADLRRDLLRNPLYASIPSMRPQANKTAKYFHAKDDHSEVRAKTFERIMSLDFKFCAVVKDMRAVMDYVERRNRMDADYRYRPNELYDLTVRMLFKERLHQNDTYAITFAGRGKSNRTRALTEQLEKTRMWFLAKWKRTHSPELAIKPAYPWEEPCLQLTDYCLWALQRCYERYEDRFLKAIWSRVSLIHDVDDPRG